MADSTKGKSPFYPGQPVPIDLFVGRSSQIDRILTRGAQQVRLGKPVAVYVEGEYGIGKSSIAGFLGWRAERECDLHFIYSPLGGARSLSDVAAAILEATLRSGAFDPSKGEKVREWLAKYVGRQELFGLAVNLNELRADAPNLATPFAMLQFLGEALHRLESTGTKGLFLVLDEINGIAGEPQFAHFIKGLVDTNAMSGAPIPLLLMLCGVEERRREMIKHHQPIDRIFDIVPIDVMNETEMAEFFTRAFESVRMTVEPDALRNLTYHSAGFPKIMHLVGDAAYWTDEDGVVTTTDSFNALLVAAEEIGKKYVDQQVYKALRSKDYHAILKKLGALSPVELSFSRAELAGGLTEAQKGKLDNFLQKMKTLNVIRNGDERGEYIFNLRMVRLYIWLNSVTAPTQ